MLNQIQKIAQQYRFTLTSLRAAILLLFLKENKPLKAYELLFLLQKTRYNAKPPTVYRVLNFFVKHQVMHQIKSTCEFVLCQLGSEQEHMGFEVILLCEQCEAINEIANHTLQATMNKLTIDYQFQANQQMVELVGICSRCQGGAV